MPFLIKVFHFPVPVWLAETEKTVQAEIGTVETPVCLSDGATSSLVIHDTSDS